MIHGKHDQEAGPLQVTIRRAVPADADGIARVFLESAAYHANLDAARYAVPSHESISARYREEQQHSGVPGAAAITLVGELRGQIVGFVDARLDQSPDPMHRDVTYCDVAEIAVARQCQHQGIGGMLLEAAEAWGRAHGADFASLEYHAQNTSASEFYRQRMGYRIAHIIAIKRL